MSVGYRMSRGPELLELFQGRFGVVIRIIAPEDPPPTDLMMANVPRGERRTLRIDYGMSPNEARMLAMQLLSLADEEERDDG